MMTNDDIKSKISETIPLDIHHLEEFLPYCIGIKKSEKIVTKVIGKILFLK